jgi:hypothetical protein
MDYRNWLYKSWFKNYADYLQESIYSRSKYAMSGVLIIAATCKCIHYKVDNIAIQLLVYTIAGILIKKDLVITPYNINRGRQCFDDADLLLDI